MFQITHPALAVIIAALSEPTTSVETFIVSDGETEAVRLVLGQGKAQIAIDVEVLLSPDGGGDYVLSPVLTSDTRWYLMSRDLLPEGQLDAMELSSQLASALTSAHGPLIARTAREGFTHRLI